METNHEDFELYLRDKACALVNQRAAKLHANEAPGTWEELPRGLRDKMFRKYLSILREQLLPASDELQPQPLVLIF